MRRLRMKIGLMEVSCSLCHPVCSPTIINCLLDADSNADSIEQFSGEPTLDTNTLPPPDEPELEDKGATPVKIVLKRAKGIG
jgi:hypothetical protein